jgi:hypothetical protein
MITHELADHGSVEELKTFATELIQYFIETRAGYTSESPTTLSLSLGDEEITVKADDVLVGQDGKLTLRRVQTGHMRSKESEDVGTAAFVLATQQAFPDANVEFLYLSDQKVHSVSLSAKKLQTRQKKLVDFLKNIRLGQFPTDPSARTCPGCPAFFICGPTPMGTLQKNFRDNLPVWSGCSD